MKTKYKFGDKVNWHGRNGIFWSVMIVGKSKTYRILFPKATVCLLPDAVKKGWKMGSR